MRHILLLSTAAVLLLLTSCRNDKNYYFTPTIGLEVQGGSTDGSVDAMSSSNSSSSSYKNYSGGAYWGDGGNAVNQHYTPYSDRSHDYDYYRGDGDDDDY